MKVCCGSVADQKPILLAATTSLVIPYVQVCDRWPKLSVDCCLERVLGLLMRNWCDFEYSGGDRKLLTTVGGGLCGYVRLAGQRLVGLICEMKAAGLGIL